MFKRATSQVLRLQGKRMCATATFGHKTLKPLSISLCLLPVAPFAAGTAAAMPINWIIAATLPLHQHFGFWGILKDYAPGPLKFAMIPITAMVYAGLINLNLNGEGISGTCRRILSNVSPVSMSVSTINTEAAA